MPANDPGWIAIDLEHLGRPASITTHLRETDVGPVLVDPGPAATLPRLRDALRRRGHRTGSLAALCLTHIHLDHAGATGVLARENPGLTVHVHEKGAGHLADPSKLISSATRLYGDRMETLWGEIAPVPPGQLRVLHGGESLAIGGVELEVAYTPGHAWHHVSYFDAARRIAFVGDTAGIRDPGNRVVLPVTPPPDFDLSSWLTSIELILRWRPEHLALTHFGIWPDPVRHFADLREGLLAWAGYARDALAQSGSDEDRFLWFEERLRSWLDGKLPPRRAGGDVLSAAGVQACWQGLARYWKKAG